MKEKTGKDGGRSPGFDSPLFHADPEDQVFDDKSRVVVSESGRDKGARTRETYPATVMVEGRLQSVSVVKDALFKMWEAGRVDDIGYKACRDFEAAFLRGHYESFTATRLDGMPGGGGMTVDDVFARSLGARDYVHHALALMGGPVSPMSCVLCDFVGMGKSFDQIARDRSDSKHFWRGAFYSAVSILVADYKRRMTQRRRTLRSSGVS